MQNTKYGRTGLKYIKVFKGFPYWRQSYIGDQHVNAHCLVQRHTLKSTGISNKNDFSTYSLCKPN